MIFVIAVIAIFGIRSGNYLVLRNGDTDEEFARFRVNEGDEFSVTFIHSVNQYPLTDVYQIKDGKIFVIRTIYNNFGAGVQTEIEEGQTLTINENGEMVVSGFDMEMPYLSYIVGTVSDHTLTIHNKEISLREICGRNSKVSFSCEHRYF
ncbi:MAG: DUF1850 domain-containing protein [Oscillospiraceae bacterium]|nr:DUF1850 domain-containing protein [Oscillospiraceae bacterium]MBP1553221.1 DUF1850 domain-containing protein [Oscillospiraceae bacterium]MBP1570814.1 DUF1850 domain-containing protein [Oscillospiraceae bacterium]MBQ5313434.1 DUF1850 domain-containing protein [Oscillospiraceae bacterium]MBQ5324830.1 DUF1850 domain-containing protein [Oscillospiraceae bacterium]